MATLPAAGRALRRTLLAPIAGALALAASALVGSASPALAAGALVGSASPALAADTVTINGATTFQTITGFGASEAFGEAQTVMNAPAAVQQQALSLL